jgi:hypothetical protein
MQTELLGWSDSLGRTRRMDPWSSLATSTYLKIAEAVQRNETSQIPSLCDFFVAEARVIFDIYTAWRRDIRRFLEAKLPNEVCVSEIARIDELIAAHHGTELVVAREAAWERVDGTAGLVKASAHSPFDALKELARLKELWRKLHDGDVDYISGLMDIVVRQLGESALGEMYEEWVLGDWFAKRYARFDVSRTKWNEAFELLVYLSFEAMHGHLCGPERDGSVGFEEFEDRVKLTFAPCGSGGRTVNGEPRDSLPALMEPPFNFQVTQNEHRFAWNRKGICAYCAHCCVLLEKLPIEKFGYPVRVVEPPVYPNNGSEKCSWTIYRRLEDIPASVYERLGYVKPAPGSRLGSARR